MGQTDQQLSIFTRLQKWAQERAFDTDATTQGQFIKLAEEMGELASNIAKGRPIKDDIGDMAVVLNNLALINGLTLKDCMEHSYNEIKDRKGRMVNGVFVKKADQK